MTTFFDINCNEGSFLLPEDESRHALKSLRIREGERIDIINGHGLVLHAVCEGQENGLLRYRIESSLQHERKSPLLHIAISPLKQMDRFEYFVEKSTELGVNQITPVLCDRTEKPKIKEDRLNRIIDSAIKQSGNPFRPIINKLTDYRTFIDGLSEKNRLMAYCEEGNKNTLPSLSLAENTVVLIGPEGDFTSDEIQLATNNNFKGLDLGNLTLRTETAALTVCAYFQMIKNS